MSTEALESPQEKRAVTSLADRRRFADVALRIAREAGRLASEGFRTRPDVVEKSAKDLVTRWDRDTEAHIVSRLSAEVPDVPIVGEESWDQSAPPTLAFVVDPIDGTTNFVHGHPFWAVSIGVLDAGHPVAGALVAPALALEWRAAVDPAGRASVAERGGQPCRVSATGELGASLLATGFPPVRDESPANNFDSFMHVKRRAQAVRRCGAAAIDAAFVGDGTYDGYWERRLHAWDVAAGGALVLAAGGRITALDGGPYDLWRGHVVMSNGRIHEELVRAVAGAP